VPELLKGVRSDLLADLSGARIFIYRGHCDHVHAVKGFHEVARRIEAPLLGRLRAFVLAPFSMGGNSVSYQDFLSPPEGGLDLVTNRHGAIEIFRTWTSGPIWCVITTSAPEEAFLLVEI